MFNVVGGVNNHVYRDVFPYYPFTFKVTGICRGSEDISSQLSSNNVAKQKNNFSISVASWGKNAKLQIPTHVNVG